MSSVTKAGYDKAQEIYLDGVQKASLIRQVAAIAAAIDNSLQLISNYKKQRDIANRATKLAEEERKHLVDTYWPKELEFLAEFGTPEEVEEADVYGRRYAGHLIAPVAKAFAKALKRARCTATRYCTSSFAITMQGLYQAHATAVTNAKIMGYCMGFAYAKAKDDVNDKRRLQALGLARGLFQTAAGLYSSAAQGLTGINGNALAELSGAIKSFQTAGNSSKASVSAMPQVDVVGADTMDYNRPGDYISGQVLSDFNSDNRDFWNSMSGQFERMSLDAKASGDESTAAWADYQRSMTDQYSSNLDVTNGLDDRMGLNDADFGKRDSVPIGKLSKWKLIDSRGGNVSGEIWSLTNKYGYNDHNHPNIESDAP